ncbi:gp126 [Bacillus phage G]|uniref:Gp126 n=1 Tax=Bacillus phage G TaxID=2884420 RepID=G3MBI8_9CAUD|nr:gp126 [Bacillus phage G]AEO93388.1 gp126 [Bacillus phage G]
MKRLIKKSEKTYETKNDNNEVEQREEVDNEVHEEVQETNHEEVHPADMEREDPYLGRYVEITNRRSKYYGYHARVDDKFYTDRYKIYLEPKRSDDDGGKGYIINFVGVNVASNWFTVVE